MILDASANDFGLKSVAVTGSSIYVDVVAWEKCTGEFEMLRNAVDADKRQGV